MARGGFGGNSVSLPCYPGILCGGSEESDEWVFGLLEGTKNEGFLLTFAFFTCLDGFMTVMIERNIRTMACLLGLRLARIPRIELSAFPMYTHLCRELGLVRVAGSLNDFYSGERSPVMLIVVYTVL